MIEVKNLYLKYIREYYALCDVSLHVKKGETVAFVGQENSGKTSLLRVLAGLEKFNKGEVYIKEIPIKKLDFTSDISLGYIPETPIFMPYKTVYENFVYVLKNRKFNAKEIEEKINNALIEFNIEKLKFTLVKDLSLFEKYIVSCVRLTLRELDIVLIDGILDKVSDNEQTKLKNLIKEHFISKKITTVIATQSDELASELCNRTIHFNGGAVENK